MLVQRWPGCHGLCGWQGGLAQRWWPSSESRQNDLRCWRPISQRAVWPYGIVVSAPAFDHDLGFPQAVEDLAIQQFVAQARVERFHIPILPWTARCDVGCL